MLDTPKAVFVFDGNCPFCRYWVHRWQRQVNERVQFTAYQNLKAPLAGFDKSDFQHGAFFFEPNGRVSRGAASVYRLKTYRPGFHSWSSWLYEHSPWFARLSEWVYTWVANHRPLLEKLIRA